MKKIIVLLLVFVLLYTFYPAERPAKACLDSFFATEANEGGRFIFSPVKVESNFSIFSIGFAIARDDQNNIAYLFGSGMELTSQTILCKKQRICNLNGASWYVYIQARPLQVESNKDLTFTQTTYYVD
jgi:hypothetical protein